MCSRSNKIQQKRPLKTQQFRPLITAPRLVIMGYATIKENLNSGGCMMKGWPMYTDIQSLKNLGFSKRKVADKVASDFRISKHGPGNI